MCHPPDVGFFEPQNQILIIIAATIQFAAVFVSQVRHGTESFYLDCYGCHPQLSDSSGPWSFVHIRQFVSRSLG